MKITNVTRGQQFTPILAATHTPSVSLFQLGQPASSELATLAEEGNVAPLTAALRANKAVLEVPEIEQCHMIAGGFDYLLKVRTGDILEYRRVMAERLSTLPFVAATSTYVAMEAVKDTP